VYRICVTFCCNILRFSGVAAGFLAPPSHVYNCQAWKPTLLKNHAGKGRLGLGGPRRLKAPHIRLNAGLNHCGRHRGAPGGLLRAVM
jgi:hypothetical protein